MAEIYSTLIPSNFIINGNANVRIKNGVTLQIKNETDGLWYNASFITVDGTTTYKAGDTGEA